MEKTPDEIYSLYENLSENSRDQASFELYDRDKKRGIYELHHDDDSKLRNEVNQINQRLEKIDLLIDNIRKPFNPQLNSNSTCPMPASGSEAQSGSSREQGLERLGPIGARVRHSPSTSPVASRLWGKESSVKISSTRFTEHYY
ncbi:unnamed protein product [Spirodela intermedia]|uniref:Uncharacterized protein n=1 Tax=Spirodela intermedia TaxID=51605 RepID=A0ABN7E936_SPIIN|nr:unnamed protein product [Spirodela intermedia]